MSVATILALAAAGVFAGAMAGLLGVGGGSIMVPALVLIAGESQHVAEGTSLAVILPTALLGTFTLARRGVGDRRSSLRIGAAGAAGAVGGALLAMALPASVLRLVFAAFVALVGLRIARQGWRAPRGPEPQPAPAAASGPAAGPAGTPEAG